MKDKIKTIQIYNQSGDMIFECNKGFSFLARKINGNLVDDVLMIKGRDLPELNTGAAADVIITTRSGERYKYFCVVNFFSARQLRLVLNTERAKMLDNQRRYYRIKAAINCRIVDVTRGENVIQYNPNLYGKIYDINIGGVFVAIESDEQYHENDLVTFTAILGGNKLEASARVLRIQTSKEGDVLGYRCCFAALSPRQEDMISSYINRLQIEERRIELELEKLEKDAES